jgi:RmlD substrate binding domain
MRVTVIGSAGQLGPDLVDILRKASDYEVFGLAHREMECSDPISIEKGLKKARPDVVVKLCRVRPSRRRRRPSGRSFPRKRRRRAEMSPSLVRSLTLSAFTSAPITYLMEQRACPTLKPTRRVRSTFTESQSWQENTSFKRPPPVGLSCGWPACLARPALAGKAKTSWKRSWPKRRLASQ